MIRPGGNCAPGPRTTAPIAEVPTTRVVRYEVAKLRRLRIPPLVIVLVAGVVALSAPELGSPAGQSWDGLLLALGFAFSLVAPMPIAVLASRQVDPEHHGNGWFLARTAGVSAGRLCRAKFAVTGAVTTAATLACTGAVAVAGQLGGIAAGFPAGRWLGWTAAVAVVNLVLLALHLVLSTWVENQLVGLGVGVLGVFVGATGSAFPGWVAHLTPWGYYTLLRPADFAVDGTLVPLDPRYSSVVVLGIVGATAFGLLTQRLDREEA